MNNNVKELYAAMCDVVGKLSKKDAAFVRQVWNLEGKARAASQSLPAHVNRRKFQRAFRRECRDLLHDRGKFSRFIDDGHPAHSYFSSAPAHDYRPLYDSFVFTLFDRRPVHSAIIAVCGITVVAGPNGCGKTTVARELCHAVTNGEARPICSHAVFIGSPEAVVSDKALRALMLRDDPAYEPPTEAKGIMEYIEDLLGGRIIAIDGKLVFRADGGDGIPLRQLASGYLVMACVCRLLANGTLDGETLLAVDAPEAHLHPSWTAELARVLVWLNKRAGVRMLLNTSDPQFLQAVKAIANREGVLKRTLFYLAADSREGGYVYQGLGQETVDIFRSINRVYDLIDTYGDEDYDDNGIGG